VSKATRKAAKKPVQKPRICGKTLGLNIKATWIKIFQENERVSKAKRLTDTALAKIMVREFPGRTPKDFLPEGVRHVRAAYNAGAWNPQPPKIQSSAYTPQGEKLAVRRGRQPSSPAALSLSAKKKTPSKKSKGVRVRKSA
jgi:hypothetical protein